MVFFRIGGPGLGNLLFPWARAHVRAAASGGRVLAPVWPQLKIGPLLRGERDLRGYGALFRSDGAGQVTGLGRLGILATARRRSEAEGPGQGEVAVVSGMADLFEPIFGHHDLIAARLREIVRQPVADAPRDEIAVHIRLGDFAPPPPPGMPLEKRNQRVPLEWYVETLAALRAGMGGETGCVVYSDGADDDLAPILAQPRTRRAPAASAIEDIFAIAMARAVIASNSTFSMWSCFLGQRPSLWYPGARIARLNAEPRLEIDHAGGPLPDSFLAGVVG